MKIFQITRGRFGGPAVARPPRKRSVAEDSIQTEQGAVDQFYDLRLRTAIERKKTTRMRRL
jgi:hypothetical protein